LTETEQESWSNITDRIRQLYARDQQSGNGQLGDRIKQLLIDRSRIAKNAEAKPDLAVQVIEGSFQRGQRWIVYCDGLPQLRDVVTQLRKKGISCAEYHSQMESDPTMTLREFEGVGGVIVSIRCLDEGVDIPSTTHALILASSKNPREFIQRRGRVLRKYPGKSIAEIHDVIVVPQLIPGQPGPDLALVRSELARAVHFGQDALNPESIIDLQRIAVQQGFDPAELENGGFEDDESGS